jgi:hypothetical protein
MSATSRLSLFLGFIFWTSLFSVIPLQASPPVDWEKISEKNGIQIFKRQLSGSPFIEVKGEGLVEASIERIAGIILDIPRTIEWVESLKEVKVTRQVSDSEFIVYTRFQSPIFFIQDRDFVTSNSFVVSPGSQSILFKTESIDELPSAQTHVTRGHIMKSTMTLQSLGKEKTFLTATLHSDPKGSIPKWIVNKFVESMPRKTFEGLRMQVAKEEKQDTTLLEKISTALKE